MIVTIWDYLKDLGYTVEPRDDKHTVHLVLESDRLNGAQKKRMGEYMHTTEKLDGVYSLVTIIPNDTIGFPQVRHWGRSGKALQNCHGLNAHIASQLPIEILEEPIILISEITSDDPLAELSGYMTPSRVNDGAFLPTNMQDNFHDILSVREFIKGESEGGYLERQGELVTLITDTHLSMVPSFGCYSLEGARELAETQIFPEGKEGLVLSALHSKWVAGARNETKIKVKEKLSYDVTVVGLCSGKTGSKYQYTLGKLLVAFPLYGDTSKEYVVIPISGMKDGQRNYWWTHPEDIVGKTVKMDAKSFTATGNLREPRFKEVREDKSSQFPINLNVNAPVSFSTKAKSTWALYQWSTINE